MDFKYKVIALRGSSSCKVRKKIPIIHAHAACAECQVRAIEVKCQEFKELGI